MWNHVMMAMHRYRKWLSSCLTETHLNMAACDCSVGWLNVCFWTFARSYELWMNTERTLYRNCRTRARTSRGISERSYCTHVQNRAHSDVFYSRQLFQIESFYGREPLWLPRKSYIGTIRKKRFIYSKNLDLTFKCPRVSIAFCFLLNVAKLR